LRRQFNSDMSHWLVCAAAVCCYTQCLL